tara:strand:+ start:1488 stop:2030 length:543 start_codon:yes stop_codon:yes gene_type:complete
MNIKQYGTALALTGAMALYSPTADAGGLRNFFKGVFVDIPANAITTVGKTLDTTVNELDPVKGARRGALDTVEATSYALTGRDSGREPSEIGKANEYIESDPALEFIVDVGVAAGASALIAGANSHKSNTVGHAAAWAAGGEAAIKAINYDRADKKRVSLNKSRGKGSGRVTKGYEVARR